MCVFAGCWVGVRLRECAMRISRQSPVHIFDQIHTHKLQNVYIYGHALDDYDGISIYRKQRTHIDAQCLMPGSGPREFGGAYGDEEVHGSAEQTHMWTSTSNVSTKMPVPGSSESICLLVTPSVRRMCDIPYIYSHVYVSIEGDLMRTTTTDSKACSVVRKTNYIDDGRATSMT